MKFRDARTALKQRNMTLSISGHTSQYRINFHELNKTKNGEATAYYTHDLEDAVRTGIAMREQKERVTRGELDLQPPTVKRPTATKLPDNEF